MNVFLCEKPLKFLSSNFTIILDEVPTREFGHTMGMFMLQSILHLHSVGVALLGLAHLVTLKEYDRAFLQKASAKYPAGSGLRAPNSVELEWADKQLWGEIASLLEKGWTFDDSVHEVVHVRSSIQSYLQPRPAAASVPPTPVQHGGLGKGEWSSGKSSAGRGRGGKKGGTGRGSFFLGKGTGSERPPRQALCMLCNQGKCDLENCQYEHLCCAAANGKPCLGNHRASEHKATPRERARRIFRRFLRAVMVSLATCFRILLLSLLR